MAYQQPQHQAHWDQGDVSPVEGSGFDFPPRPPPHRHAVGMHPDSQYQQHQDPNNYSNFSVPRTTPPMDNAHEHSSGRHTPGSPPRPMGVPENMTPFNDQYAYESPSHPRAMYSQRSLGSNAALAPGRSGVYSSNSSIHSNSAPFPAASIPYSDSPYNRYSSSAQNLAPQMGQINPHELADDDDWGMGPETTQNKRRSFVPFGASRDGSRQGSPGSSIKGNHEAGAAGAAAGAAAAGTATYAASRDGGGKYNAVPGVTGVNASREMIAEKSDWAKKQDLRKRKMRMWIVIAIIAVVLIGAVLGGVLGALLNKGGSKDGSGSGGSNANNVASDNRDDLDINSSEIKALMNNPNLHKVFPGIDYTPLNCQYPNCLTTMPSQNNVTRDMAVLSQLTNAVRLYGTDCNQTQMVIHAIDRLQMKDTMKIWLGVWLDNNATTTQRQIDQTWQILDQYGCDWFKGIIVGNEVLFRKDMTPTELIGHVTDFRKNITAHNCQLPVAMADLGDNWTADMATQVDIVMSNVHPFFAGVDSSIAASWTWNFWQQHDVSLTSSNSSIKQVIAEVGWPSAGGKDCGSSSTCDSSTPGSIAGIDQMNQFMSEWVCQSMKNGTVYFWFEAFDEPWKIQYDTPGKDWEDKWGLMDVNRNLKSGVKIPSCTGLTLPS